MNSLNNLFKNKASLFLVPLVLFALFPMLPEAAKGTPVVLFTLLSVIFLFIEKKKIFNYKLFLILASIFIINVLSIVYSLSFEFPNKKFETSLSLLLIPLSFSILQLDYINYIKQYRKLFCNLFVIASSILAVLFLLYYLKLGLFSEGTLKVNSFRDASTEAPFIMDHPIYVSMFYGLALLFITHELRAFKRMSKKYIILYTVSVLMLCINLILLASKGALMAVVAALIFYFAIGLKGKSKYYLIVSILLLFVSIIIFSPTVRRRFKEFGIITTYTKFHITNSSSLRVAIYKCAAEKIKESPLVGYGWGETKQTLKNCYKDKYDHLHKGNYNSHNQYLGYFLNGGILGLIVLLFFLINTFRYSIKNKDYIYSATLVFFSLMMLFENILERQSGLIIFIFIVSFFRMFKHNKI